MSRLSAENEVIAHEIISRYPRKKSALIGAKQVAVAVSPELLASNTRNI